MGDLLEKEWRARGVARAKGAAIFLRRPSRPSSFSVPDATPRHASPRSWTGLTLALAARAAANPSLAIDLLRVAWRFRDRRWWRRFPFLPLPAKDYVRWRMHTAYGDDSFVPPPEDVIRYARWAVRDR